MQTSTARLVRFIGRITASALTLALCGTAGAAVAATTFPGGVDTSNYQHGTSLNWSSVKNSGVKFAFLKATEGSTFADPYFASDWAATGRVGIYHGAYHFARPGIGNAAAQARYFVSKIGRQTSRGTLPPVLDLEASGGLTPSQLITWTHTWLNTVQQLTGRDPIIYVSPAFWKYNMANSAGFHNYPLWIANYGVSLPTVPGGWPTWSFWQTSSTGRISGISGSVDRDVFNGSMTQLQKFALAYNPVSTNLSLAPSSTAPMSGQTVTFSGTLRDSSGRVVTGKTVTLSTQKPGTTTWTQVGTATTSSTGTYSMKSVVVTAGAYRTGFSGDSSYRASTSPVSSLTLTPIPTAVTLSPSRTAALAGSTVTLEGALRATSTKPLSGKQVAIMRQLPGTTSWNVLAKTTTDSTGSFSVPATMMKSAAYRAQYVGDQVYAAAASPSQAVTVTLNPTAVSLNASNSAPYARRYIQLSGSLLSGTRVVAGRTVKVERQLPGTTTWSVVASVVTDSTGHFMSSQFVDQAADYRAEFTADPLYLGSTSAPATVTITPPSATRLSLSSQASWIRRGTTTLLTGRLTTGTGQPVVGRTVCVYKRLPGTSTWSLVRGAWTDSNGAWHLTVGPRETAWFRATFNGGTRYATSGSPAVRIAVG